MFAMIYGERLGDRDKGEEYIAERGVFFSVEEFVPYRRLGWEGTTKTNTLADEIIRLDDLHSVGEAAHQ